MHRLINIIYTGFSLIQLTMAFLNFYKKMYFLNFPNLVLLILRLAIRLFDIENSYPGFGAYYWYYMLSVSLSACFINVHMILNFCKNNWISYIIILLLFLFFIFSTLYGIQVGIYSEKNEPFVFKLSGLYVSLSAFAILSFIIFEILCSSLNIELFNNMQYKIMK